MRSSSRRDRHDIVAEILESAKGGAFKTHIMYKAKLSYVQLTEYIAMLVERGLLEDLTVVKYRREKHLWRTTGLGAKFLENLRFLNLLWSADYDPDNKAERL